MILAQGHLTLFRMLRLTASTIIPYSASNKHLYTPDAAWLNSTAKRCRSGAYRNVLRYTGVYQGVRIAGATVVAVVVLVVADLLMVDPVFLTRGVPLSVV